ncbi:MAG TPA: PQQ-binding-like beta-propeller repeat protein [Gemmataceae bacterium]|jgi:tetratricopeptide (TPR) repeat protein
MSWNARRASIVLLALIVGVSALCLDSGRAQDKLKEVVKQPAAPPVGAQPPSNGDAGMNPDGFVTGGISLPKDEKGRGKALEAAVDYIERAIDQSSEESWATAIETLQKLLKIDEDVYVRLKRTNAEGKTVFVWVSAKQEADRIIGTLPKEGMERYQGKYGDEAAALLKKAKKNGDSTELAKIMKFYAHTEAGGEAIKLLADYHLDRGNYIIAQGCYNKLLNRQGGDKLPAEILAKAWLATRMSPASTTSGSTSLAGSVLTASELSRRLREQGRELKFGEQTIDLSDFEDYVGKLHRPGFDQNATDAIVFRSTPNRANQLVGGPAFMQANRRWRMYYLDSELSDRPLETTAMETMSADEKASPAHDRIEKAKDHLSKANQPIIPAFSPITVTLTKDGRKQPLLVYKNYWGIVARDLKTSEIAWAAPSNWSLQRMLASKGDTAKTQHLNNWFNSYQTQFPQIVLENSTVGTLSTDGQFVYTIEDLAVPPPPNVNFNNGMVFPGGVNPNNYPADLQDAIAHSRLQAFGLGNGGKLTWELGGEEKGPLAGCYFLGPPLPLAGKLYLLVDKQQELRLVCLETIEGPPGADGKPTYVPRVISSQALGTTQEKMEHDVFRRASAAHLAYGEGILVCPTNAGAVFGINLLENSLVWAYPYREKSDQQAPQLNGRAMGGMRRGVPIMVGPNGQPITPLTNHEHRWKASAPVISDGKVVFTAPDAKSLHCINLRDGSPVWRKPKLEDDLYLGNVYNGTVLIVGKKNVRGLSLTSGEILWTLETGLPSGLGIGSDNVYYLPLKADSKDKKPQIAAIDMDHGTLRPSPSRPRTPGDKDYEVPGNLLFYEGDVVSLTADEITVYPQLKRKIADMDAQLAKNPNDPIGLTERGDLRLAKNDLAGAIEDLSTALKNNPDAETRERARGKLYDTLTVYIKENFNEAEKYLDEYQELCKLDVDNAPAAKKADLLAEQRRRRANFLWLVGKGREEQGRLVEAFEKYQQFGAEAGKQSELVPAIDERQVKAAPDVWSRGRIIAMMNKATPENRAPLEKLIADKWDKLRETNDLDELRGFVRMFGSVSDAGKEARLQLVERLMEQKDSPDVHPLLEAELELNQFRTGRHAPELAARATEALARLYIHKGLLEDAAYCYRKLGSEFAKVLIRDGKTGKQIYDDDAATDKRLIPYLDDPQPLGSVKFNKSKKETPAPATTFADLQPGGPQFFQFEHSGENLPFFRHHLVGIATTGSNQESFKLLDRTLEDEKTGAPREIFARKLTPSGFQVLAGRVLGNQVTPNLPTTAAARFPYQTLGHLIVLPAGRMIYGIDPVNHRVLWEKDLAAGGSGPNAVDPQNPNALAINGQPVVDPRDGSMLIAYTNNWAQRLGQAGSLQGQAICVQTRETLTALDPLTGRSLWSRMDVNSRNYLFADEEHVFVVELSDGNVPHATRVFRAADGITVKAPDFTALFQRRLQVFGRHLLLSEPGPGNGVLVRLYDVLTGQDIWKQTYAARSLVAHSEDPSLTAVVEPDGKVHVIDLAARKEVMAGQMDKDDLAKHLRNVQIVHLLADRDNFYIACQAPVEMNNNNRMGGGILSSVMTHLGMRTLPVNGYIYAFPRDSKGDFEWFAEVKNQFLLLEQFQDLPLIVLAARHQVMQNRPGQPWAQQVSVTSIEKRRGNTVFFDDKLNGNTTGNFFTVRVDARASTVELLAPNLKITHYSSTDAKDKAARDPRPAADAPAPPQTQPAPAKGIGGPIKRAPVDRVRIREIAPPLPPR